jgi:hypothetical protein
MDDLTLQPAEQGGGKVLNFSAEIYANLFNDVRSPCSVEDDTRNRFRITAHGDVKVSFNGYKWTTDGGAINYSHLNLD